MANLATRRVAEVSISFRAIVTCHAPDTRDLGSLGPMVVVLSV